MRASTTTTQSELRDLLFETLQETIQPARQGLLILPISEEALEPQFHWKGFSKDEQKQIADENKVNSLVKLIENFSGEVVSTQQIELLVDQEIEYIFPFSTENLIGVYMIGKRESGRSYSEEDLDLISNLLQYFIPHLYRFLDHY